MPIPGASVPRDLKFQSVLTQEVLVRPKRLLELSANDRVHRISAITDPVLQVFVYLQLLDFLTTILGFRVGASEASPFVGVLMHAGAVTGVLISKLLALGLGGICLWLGKYRMLYWANYWFAALVLWNIFVILTAAARIHG